jgi:hypothetical protein
VIVVGYPREMEQFLNSNPGLKSRFGIVVAFPDYQPDEMLTILKLQAEKEHYIVPEEVAEKAKKSLIMQAQAEGVHFGNARSVLSLYEKMKNNLAERMVQKHQGSVENLSNEALNCFERSDVPDFAVSIVVGKKESAATDSADRNDPGSQDWVLPQIPVPAPLNQAQAKKKEKVHGQSSHALTTPPKTSRKTNSA